MELLNKLVRPLLDAYSVIYEGRSPQWSRLEKEHLLKFPTCAACGVTTDLAVHHIIPFHVDPSKELDPNNLITLSTNGVGGANLHLLVGHLGNWKSWNVYVIRDAAFVLNKIQSRPLLLKDQPWSSP